MILASAQDDSVIGVEDGSAEVSGLDESDLDAGGGGLVGEGRGEANSIVHQTLYVKYGYV